jgi:hypothetical protein
MNIDRYLIDEATAVIIVTLGLLLLGTIVTGSVLLK